jgi:hypothetical protein
MTFGSQQPYSCRIATLEDEELLLHIIEGVVF